MSNTNMIAAEQYELTDEQLATLEQAGVIPPKCPPAQVSIFAEVCRTAGLSPFRKQIYLVGYAGKYSVIVGIDGYRAVAERTGLHAGTDEAKFDLTSDGRYKSAAEFTGKLLPQTATVTVYKVVGGLRVPFTHTAKLSEFKGGGKWDTMPFQMLAKVAEAHALRKAFPGQVSGFHVPEELDAIQDTVEPEYRKLTEEEREAENQRTKAEERIVELLGDLTDQNLRARIKATFKRRWKDEPDWRGPIIEKNGANELDLPYLTNYCLDDEQ